MCQQKQTDGVTVVVKNTAEDFEAAKASHKCKNRLETKHFNTISVCVAPNGVQRRVFAPKGVCYVNQLFYYRPNDKSTISKAVVAYAYEVWWTVRDSNPGPTGYEPAALPTELTVQAQIW